MAAVIRHSTFILFCSGQHRPQGYTGASLRFGLVPGAFLHTCHSVVMVALASFLGRYPCLCSQLTSFRPPDGLIASRPNGLPLAGFIRTRIASQITAIVGTERGGFEPLEQLVFLPLPGGSFLLLMQNQRAFRFSMTFRCCFTSAAKTSTFFDG